MRYRTLFFTRFARTFFIGSTRRTYFFTFFLTCLPVCIFAQIELDSIHYINIEPLRAIKNGKVKTSEDNYLFHMYINTVHPYGYATSKKAYQIIEKTLIDDHLFILAEKMTLFKQQKTFSIPLSGNGVFTIKSKHQTVEVKEFEMKVVKYKRVNL